MVRLATVLLLLSAPAFAQSWAGTGVLVDAHCYDSAERNVTKNTSDVEHDVSLEVRLCAPNSETREFGVLTLDSHLLKLDAAGNQKAAEIVRNAGKRSMLRVTVTGDRDQSTIRVASMSRLK